MCLVRQNSSKRGTDNITSTPAMKKETLNLENLEKGTGDYLTVPRRDHEEQDSVSVSSISSEERAEWDSKGQYLLSVVGYAVGLGNVWRFPYLLQKNGGGAFLIPYFIMLVTEGIPLFYLELAVGQTHRKGSIGVWSAINPYLGGVGYGSAVVSFLVGLYYNVIIMWCLFYLFNSFTAVLPWSECPTEMISENITKPVAECELSDSTSYFWYRSTLNMSDKIEDFGEINWRLMLCLLCAWIVVYICLCKGIKSQGKAVYFTSTFPYIVLFIFFGRAVTLPGASLGLEHMFTPKWEKLLDPQVWLDAATQIFYSLGLAFGGLIAFSSYNNVKNNCKRDAIFISITNCSTSIFASLVIFCVLGFKATMMYDRCMDRNIDRMLAQFPDQYNKSDLTPYMYNDILSGLDVDTVKQMAPEVCSLQEDLDKAAEGTGLAFIVFTQAIVEFPAAPFWSIIFFLMLLTLGLGSQFGTVESVITSITDMSISPAMKRKEIVAAIVCGSSFVIGLLFVTQAGQYWVGLFDTFAGSFPLMTIAFFEVIGVVYIYGMKKFSEDIKFITGANPGLYWQITWRFVAPFMMGGILIASVIAKFLKPITYHAYDSATATFHSQPYPTWVMAVIFLLILASALCLPMVAILRKLGIMKYDSAKSAVILTGGTTQSTAAMLADYPEADSGRSESDSYSLESNTQVDSKIDITNVDSCVGESIEVSELNKGYLVLKMSESNI